jgi:hypothetical protein
MISNKSDKNGKTSKADNDNGGCDPGDPFDNLTLPDEPEKEEKFVSTPGRVRRRRQQFVMVPMTWVEALSGATGKTVLLALHLLYLGWKRVGPVKLPNGMLRQDGISRYSKWRGLKDLERRGLISVERRSHRSPLVTLLQR